MSESSPFEGFDIPVDLAILTGGGPDTWEGISAAHLAAYARHCPLRAGDDVLEVGCGLGRDAIPLTRVLGHDGSYVGVDVSGRSIAWCGYRPERRRPERRRPGAPSAGGQTVASAVLATMASMI